MYHLAPTHTYRYVCTERCIGEVGSGLCVSWWLGCLSGNQRLPEFKSKVGPLLVIPFPSSHFCTCTVYSIHVYRLLTCSIILYTCIYIILPETVSQSALAQVHGQEVMTESMSYPCPPKGPLCVAKFLYGSNNTRFDTYYYCSTNEVTMCHLSVYIHFIDLHFLSS